MELTAFLIRARGCVPALFNVVWRKRSYLETNALQLSGDIFLAALQRKSFSSLRCCEKAYCEVFAGLWVQAGLNTAAYFLLAGLVTGESLPVRQICGNSE